MMSKFEWILNSINRCYDVKIKNKLPEISDFPSSIADDKNQEVNIDFLLEFAKHQNDKYLLSVSKRICAVRLIQEARDQNRELDLKKIWTLISESISALPNDCVISSVGSQGFLSIPLFKYDETMDKFEFIRLHIWDDSLSNYVKKDVSNDFSIHSHSFLAQSWVILGNVINERYSVDKVSEDTKFSLFKIDYNKTLNEVNQHTSVAVNTNSNVNLKKISYEEHFSGSTYKIKTGKFHKSGSKGNHGLSATFFSFTSDTNKIPKSYVVGPSNINDSEINRKMYIDPLYLVDEISSNLI